MGMWDLPAQHCIGDTELRFNPYHDYDPTNERFTSGSEGHFKEGIYKNFSSKSLDKSELCGIIKSYTEFRYNPYHDSKGKFASGITVRLPDGKDGRLANKGLVSKIVQIAGEGTNKPIKIAEALSERFHNKPSDWSKFRGDAYVTYPDGTTRHVEVHWFLNKQNGIFDFKVKREF